MRSNVDAYVAAVLECIVADDGLKKRIEKDLLSHINEASAREREEDILLRMGKPEEVAREFMDNIYENKEDVIEKLVQERSLNKKLLKGYYEYKSKAVLFGLPLVHVKLSRRYYSKQICVAKGIIAIGDVSVGVLSMGALAFGGICLGGLSVGLISFAGIAFGLLLAMGGVAIGGMAMGGVAIGLGAVGGVAMGKIAVGGFAKGVVAIGGKAVGDFVISGNNYGNGSYILDSVSKQQISDVIRMGYPGINEWIVKFFTIFGA